MTNKPKLRFKEFDNDWHNSKLKNLVNIIDGDRGKNYPKEDEFSNTGYCLFLNAKNVTKQGFRFEETQYITEEKDVLLRNGKLKRNDLVITSRGTVGNIALYNNVIPIDNIRINSGMLILRAFNINPQYLYNYRHTEKFQKQLTVITSGNAQPQLTVANVNDLQISFPCSQEQQKIADFLSKVDEIITEREEEVKNLEQKKKGLMQKLFSQQIRFTDSNNNPYPDWEEYQLKDVLTKVIDNRGKTPALSSKGYPLLEIASMQDNRINYSKISKYVDEETYKNFFRGYIEQGDVLFSTVGFYAGEVSYYDKQIDCTIAQNIVGLRFDNSNSLFMTYLLSEANNKKRIKAIEMNQAQPSIKVTQLIELKFKIPQLEEQQKIANVFSKIDELIEEKKALLSDWQQFKKGLLQQMFV